MDEDEEVDIVGGLDNFMSKNEREISNLSSGQILSCEYTVHPRWLTDNNDGAENLWPENLPKQSSQDEMELVQDEVVIEEPAPIDFDWVEERETEEASNCGDIIFEQDIPASIEEEVVIGTEETAYEDNDHSDCCSQSSQESGHDRDSTKYSNQLPDTYVPESSNAKSMSLDGASNLDKPTKPAVKFKQTLMVSKNLLILNRKNFTVDPKAGTSLLKIQRDKSNDNEQVAPLKIKRSESKFSVAVKIDSRHVKSNKKSKSPKKHKHRTHHTGSSTKAKNGGKESFSGKSKKFVDIHGENITINHEADTEYTSNIDDEILQLNSKPNISSNKAKIRHESESDVEIDIESDTPNDLIESHDSSAMFSIVKSEPTEPITSEKVPPLKIKAIKKKEPEEPKLNLNDIDPELLRVLNNPDGPTEELVLPLHQVSELEKYFHSEFFEGRPTKTPERYTKIRDFILNAWAETKPGYVSKTTVRNGLKHCGDVNCISRIHCMLEQIGAINFGYAREHFEYIRPLIKLKEHFMQSVQNKKSLHSSGNHDMSSSLILGRRQRNKSITVHSTEKEIDANYTVSHVNGVPTLVYAAVPKDRESLRREASKPIKMEFELIECLRFPKEKVPPFRVSMNLSTLLCLYLHALSSKFEVMGFLGGFCTKSAGRNKLSLTRYKPCKTAHQTTTTCEMCPVSQVEQAANMTNEGYELVGWFHSHPTFEANPSRTDVGTQADMQLQFSIESDRPFIGFILNCIDMGFNCMYILPKDIHKDTIDIIPYGFEVDIIKDCSSLRNDIADVFNVIDRNSHNYVQTIEKFIKTGTELLRYHGYDLNISDYLQSYL
ncbi:histone H2A deubiquitinase MYSM1-like [Contarinia nasturtii]|uniref:histone H2A deubiquitinase MYSM1-like n=1 Tax=Contarinia nasturtii TaxID=265458 RepID=UPI0012D384E2|nr:histone H2A deubiquitinase MYSM1-like [Contarinia nasturtii]